MPPVPAPAPSTATDLPGDWLRETLLLDLEVSARGSLLKIGAVLGSRTLASPGGRPPSEALTELAGWAAAARAVLGHNLVRHDLPYLRQARPDHPLLRLPVVDTLVLSPIAFPENPYHRLVKDYKLVRESVNDPVADARQAACLFADEWASLVGMRQTEPGLFALLHFLLATPGEGPDLLARGLDLCFQAWGGRLPSTDRALALLQECFQRWGCASVPVEPILVQTVHQRQALAYTVAWLRVAGANSVLPPWVRLEHPATSQWIHRLREVPCASPHCAYCRRVHHAQTQLRTFFEFPDFRPEPRSPQGGSLQQEIVEAGLRGESLLAILPTSGGKSLGYQLPALVRHFRRGTLTIVLSPLQALMKDQVDGLARRTGTPFAAALYGLLTPPERSDVLRRVRLGDLALLYVSPEQLRHRSFREAIAQREVGAWVFDEAHCLSKWGHDFRPDYLYAGRFIREFSKRPGREGASIAAFTATAKHEVKEEILAFFRTETGRELRRFEGGVERENLRFEVQTVTAPAKLERLHDLLAERLPPGRPGSAIVFRARRQAAEETAEFLQAKHWAAAHFHAGLSAPEKQQTQDRFLAGDVQVICATNAFGMGIDKEDVRLVIHADIPGSLENYLQEAGRAGRDGQQAACVLLYDEADAEEQFRLGAISELSRHDIAQILRGLRHAARRGRREEIVITAGEILRDEEVETEIALHDRGADTKVRTAIAWLERAGFLQRDENVTQVIQARPLVQNIAEAEARLARLQLPPGEQACWLAILRRLIQGGPDDRLTVDEIALLPEFSAVLPSAEPGRDRVSPEYVSARILKTLGSMAGARLLKRDTLLNAYVRHQVADPSRARLDRLVVLDRRLVDLLATEAPDPEGWMPLCLRRLNQRLTDDQLDSSIESLRRLLQSLSEDGRGFAGATGSLDLLYAGRDAYRVRVRRSWKALGELAEKRRRVASLLLDRLLAKIPPDTPPRAELLVEFSWEELQETLAQDLLLRVEIKDPDAALARALLYLHEHRIIHLQQGLAIFRAAMTIRLQPEARRQPYRTSDYQPLAHHYQARILQVHVMTEYARRGLQAVREALALVLAYFQLGQQEFVRRFLPQSPELLRHATTAASYQRLVTDLANSDQIRIVTAPTDRNLLVLAGPGAGKTRTVVHRCGFLLRVARVPPHSILVCCFNRQAAFDLRRRLTDLVGNDARGVTVLTYHSLALRLLGRSLAARAESAGPEDLDLTSLIPEATRLLRGEILPAGCEPDEVRDRLLAGFQYLLVDEYQDIDQPQYELLSALAGRTLPDADQKLSILAVGDDDQNIYTFRGANVEFIRRFQRDYHAEVTPLVENYRATRHLIAAANTLIAANTDRMKTDHPIRIDRQRASHPEGGPFAARDPLGQGQVQILPVSGPVAQARATLAEVRRLHHLGVTDWSQFAVLSLTHRELGLVRSLAEAQGLPVRWCALRSSLPPLTQIREVHRFLQQIHAQRGRLARARDWVALAKPPDPAGPANPWLQFVHHLLDTWRAESEDAELPVAEALDFFYESCAESRRDFSWGQGITLSTVHAAKGTEFDHVLLLGAWRLPPERARQEELRRAFYVGMTRARHTLAVLDRSDIRPSLPATLHGPPVLRREPAPETDPPPTGPLPSSYAVLGLDDIYLSYAASFAAEHPLHTALAALQPGDRLRLVASATGVALCDAAGLCVARLSRKAAEAWSHRLDQIREARVLAMVRRTSAQEPESDRREQHRVTAWEVPLVELVCADDPEPAEG